MRTVTSFLLRARSRYYFVSKCSSLQSLFLTLSVSLLHPAVAVFWLAPHLCLSNIILHLAAHSAQRHLNSYHYNQHPNCPRFLQNKPLLLLLFPFSLSSLAYFINHLHAFTSLLTFSSIFHFTVPQREQKLISCHSR